MTTTVPTPAPTCAWCKGPIPDKLPPKTSGGHCSRSCESKTYHARRKADGRAKRMVANRRTPRICAQCRVEFIASEAKVKYCSNTCQAEYEHGPDRCRRRKRRVPLTDRQRLAHVKLRRAARGTTGGRVRWVQGRCTRCGTQFLTQSDGAIAAYCSWRCRQRDRNDRKRARRSGCRISPGSRYAVFERDGWVCQLCAYPTDPTVRAPNFNAPTIDHRIPLALLGDHGPHNWQTAHFLCNADKRDTITGEPPARTSQTGH